MGRCYPNAVLSAIINVILIIKRGACHESCYHTVIGHDTVGVVARVSAVCAELNINIEDITQSILQDMFCMIMLVDISACASEPAEIRARFDTLGQEMGMQVTVTRQEVFDAMHKV